MKKLSFFLVFFVIMHAWENLYGQRTYIDLTNSEQVNSNQKFGWGKIDDDGPNCPNFEDIFDGLSSSPFDWVDDDPPGSWTCSLDHWYSTYWMVLQSDYTWLWRGDPNCWTPSEPHYYSMATISGGIEGSDNYVSLGAEYSGGDIFGNPIQYPVKKFYETSIIHSGPLQCEGNPYVEGKSFLYGWFEIRCRLPVSKYAFPAFWLNGGYGGSAYYNEIDCFELGSDDRIVHTNHWWTQSPDERHYTSGKYTFSLPGQKFGGKWVTYAVKWEPNKIIWYIDNKPVYIVRDIDKDYANASTAIITDASMFVILNNLLNIEWTRYNMDQAFVMPNSMDIDYPLQKEMAG